MRYTHISLRSFLSVLALAFCMVMFTNAGAANNNHKNHKGKVTSTKDDRIGKWTNDLQKNLSLTDDQSAKVHQILSDAKKDIMNDRRDTKGKTTADIQKTVQDRIQKVDNDIRDVLNTDAQKAKFADYERTFNKDLNQLWSSGKSMTGTNMRDNDNDKDNDRGSNPMKH